MKIRDEKTKRTRVVFNEYNLNGATACPECHQPLTDYDFKIMEELGYRSCIKCGAKLKK